MTRGTTPELTFKLPFSTDTLDKIYITFTQNRSVVFEKTENDCDLDGNVVKLPLLQQDTLMLKNDITVEIQLRCVTLDGKRIASDIIQSTAKRILKEGEI